MMLPRLVTVIIVSFYSLCAIAQEANSAPSVAFAYGRAPDTQALQAHDWVVVEPAHLAKPPQSPRTQWFAYLSLGEITADRSYAKLIPDAWVLGNNKAWGGKIIDQRPTAWPDFVVNQMVRPLWNAGYRSFFLDTLDAWQSVSKTDAERKAHAEGLVRVIKAIKKHYPEAKLIANRGFELMPKTHDDLVAVAFESYLRSYDAANKRYQAVPEADRQWLNGQLQAIREQYHLPIIAIDYVPPSEHALARSTADALRQHGFIPWVTDASLEKPGIGLREPIGRTILIFYDQRLGKTQLNSIVASRLNWLGYRHRFINAFAPIEPQLPINENIGGIVSWIGLDDAPANFQNYIKQELDKGTPWLALDHFGFRLEGPWSERLGITVNATARPDNAIRVQKQTRLLAYETALPSARESFKALSNTAPAQIELEFQDGKGLRYQAVAITEWGGYALYPFAISTLPNDSARWVVDPTELLSRALRLPAIPVPDVTTENGRRILFAHIDGDGFISPAEMPGYPPAAAVMQKEILEKYPSVPTTVSVIEGEIGPSGLFPESSAKHEQIARSIFTLSNVEIASHSYSHPFRWLLASTASGDNDAYHLKIPNYSFDLTRETLGSINYINTKLAPANKKTKVFLWTGDCDPTEEAIRLTREAGLLNMNAGDTTISKSEPSLTAVAPIGIYKGNQLQIFAPNQNENVYTNDWLGPYYGFRRVIETFEMTENPRRLKPINIYYHFYSASKRASLIALQEVYKWALAQDVNPMFGSEYIQRAEGLFNVEISRTSAQGYEIRNGGALRTLRLPLSAGYPNLSQSKNVAGYFDDKGARYIHLSAGDARLNLQTEKPVTPYLAYANAQLSQWSTSDQGFDFSLKGWLPLQFALGNVKGCQLTQAGKPIQGRQQGDLTLYELNQNAATSLKLAC